MSKVSQQPWLHIRASTLHTDQGKWPGDLSCFPGLSFPAEALQAQPSRCQLRARCFKTAEPFVGVKTAGNHRSPNL